MKKKLTLACGAYDRTAPLADGRIRVEGVDLTVLTLPVEEIFYRTAKFAEFDVAEMSLSSYALTMERGAPFIAIPVFPSRSFRHNGIYVNSGSGIEAPADLIGKRIGIPEYQMTAAVWIRGFLADSYGVSAESVKYLTGGLQTPGRDEKLPISPPGIDISAIPPGRTLDDMLVTGELDAVYSPRIPRSFVEGNPAVRRLWQDPKAEEVSYFRRTGIFPIMHTVVIRKDVYEQNRWLAGSLFKAFSQAKALVTANVEETAALSSILPFSYADAGYTREVMGEDFWPYGIDANRHVIETLLRYSYDQGLVTRKWEVDDLFAPETQNAFVI